MDIDRIFYHRPEANLRCREKFTNLKEKYLKQSHPDCEVFLLFNGERAVRLDVEGAERENVEWPRKDVWTSEESFQVEEAGGGGG